MWILCKSSILFAQGKAGRCKVEKAAGTNKQPNKSKEAGPNLGGVKMGGSVCPWATTEWTTCNNSGGLNLGGQPERHDKLITGIITGTFPPPL